LADQIKGNEGAGRVAREGEERDVYRLSRRWEDEIRMDLREKGCRGEGIQLAQDTDWWRALVNTVMDLRVLAPRSYFAKSPYTGINHSRFNRLSFK
jgi:hypothetical protein